MRGEPTGEFKACRSDSKQARKYGVKRTKGSTAGHDYKRYRDLALRIFLIVKLLGLSIFIFGTMNPLFLDMRSVKIASAEIDAVWVVRRRN